MTLALHTLPKRHGRSRKRLGRGHGSGRGITSGRGTKGQRARTGGKSGLDRRAIRDLFLRTPKQRGFKSMRVPYRAVPLAALEKRCADGATVTLATLKGMGYDAGQYRGIKIIGAGLITKKLTVHAHAFSAQAQHAITTAGGTTVLLRAS